MLDAVQLPLKIPGKPFAVSNRCRHLFASLGKGRVTDDGCLQCHGMRRSTTSHTGKMVRGPQGAFRPLSGAIEATTCARSLKTFPVECATVHGWSPDPCTVAHSTGNVF